MDNHLEAANFIARCIQKNNRSFRCYVQPSSFNGDTEWSVYVCKHIDITLSNPLYIPFYYKNVKINLEL